MNGTLTRRLEKVAKTVNQNTVPAVHAVVKDGDGYYRFDETNEPVPAETVKRWDERGDIVLTIVWGEV